MTRFPFAMIGFDLDGTLVDSSGDLTAAVNHVLATLGHPPLSVAQVTRNIGGGGRRMLARSLADAGLDPGAQSPTLYDGMIDWYGAHIADTTRPYPGVADALDTLAERGARLAVVTNKGERLARTLLDALGLAGRFEAIIGGDSVPRPKPDPAAIDAMIDRLGGGPAAFVGDSAFDIAAAHAAGIPAVAVSFGFANQPIETLHADAVIDHFSELPPALDRLGAQAGR